MKEKNFYEEGGSGFTIRPKHCISQIHTFEKKSKWCNNYSIGRVFLLLFPKNKYDILLFLGNKKPASSSSKRFKLDTISSKTDTSGMNEIYSKKALSHKIIDYEMTFSIFYCNWNCAKNINQKVRQFSLKI